MLHRPVELAQYTAGLVRAACSRLGIAQSMGRPGSALDNAVIESWHSTLEFELRRVEHFATRDQARTAVAAWIEDYNTRRRHTACQKMPPAAYEQLLAARSFLLGPDGPAGAPPGQRLRSGAFIGLRENREQKQDPYYKVSTVRGEPPSVSAQPGYAGDRGRQ